MVWHLLKAVFRKFSLVHSWIPWVICTTQTGMGRTSILKNFYLKFIYESRWVLKIYKFQNLLFFGSLCIVGHFWWPLYWQDIGRIGKNNWAISSVFTIVRNYFYAVPENYTLLSRFNIKVPQIISHGIKRRIQNPIKHLRLFAKIVDGG